MARINDSTFTSKRSVGHWQARFAVYLFSLTLALAPPVGMAQQESADEGLAGRVVMTSGAVAARDASGSDRGLRRGMPVFEGETIFTDADSSVQLRMVDGAMIALQETSTFELVAYQFVDGEIDTNRSSINLIQGGMRTITGTIADQNKEAYEATAGNFATIGIRGTDYEVVITPAGQVLTGVYNGGTTVGNGAGAIDLGVEADYDFAILQDANTPPQGLTFQPPGLGNLNVATLSQIAADDDADDEPAAEDSEPAEDGDVPEQVDGDGAGDAGDTDDADNSTPVVNPNSNAGGVQPTQEEDSSLATSAVESNLNLAPPAAEIVAETPAAAVINASATNTEQNQSSASEVRVNPNETSVAATIDTGNNGNGNGNSGNGNGNGNSGGGSTGNGNSGNGNGNSGGGTTTDGGSTGNGNSGNGNGNSGGGTTTDGGSTGNGNSGNGNGNSGGGSTGNGNSGNGNGNSGGGTTTDGGTTGNGNSGNGNGNSGGGTTTDGGSTGNGNSGNGNSGGGTTTDGGTTGNGNSGNGNANSGGGSTGNGNSGNGNSGGGTTTDGGTTGNGNSGNGNSGGGSTSGGSTTTDGGTTAGNGNSGNGNSGGSSSSGGSTTTDGGTTAGNGNSGNGNSGGGSSSGGSTTTDGGTTTGNGNSGNGNSGGGTTSGSTSGSGSTSTTTVDQGLLDRLGNLFNGNGGGGGNGGSNGGGNGGGNGNGKNSLTLAAATIETMDVSWGQWDQPLDQNWVVVQELESELVRISTSEFFADVNPTAIANLTGNHIYRTGIASSFIGSGSAGDISSLVASMAVDFSTGAIADGSLQVLAGNQAWEVSFDGLVHDGMVDLNALSGQLSDPTGIISNSIGADINGAFTGTHGEAFVGGFEMVDEINSINSVNGLFTIER